MHPEMIALGVGINDAGAADAHDFFQIGAIRQDGSAQVLPIPALATGDDIIDGRQGQILMIEVSVDHNNFKLILTQTRPHIERINHGANC